MERRSPYVIHFFHSVIPRSKRYLLSGVKEKSRVLKLRCLLIDWSHRVLVLLVGGWNTVSLSLVCFSFLCFSEDILLCIMFYRKQSWELTWVWSIYKWIKQAKEGRAINCAGWSVEDIMKLNLFRRFWVRHLVRGHNSCQYGRRCQVSLRPKGSSIFDAQTHRKIIRLQRLVGALNRRRLNLWAVHLSYLKKWVLH